MALHMNLSEQLLRVVRLDQTAPALEFEQEWWSWGNLWQAWSELDEALRRSGIGEKAPIGVVLRNRPECVAALIATVGTGRCVVTISALMSDEAISNELGRLEIAAVVAPAMDWERPGFDETVRSRGILGLSLGRTAGQVRRRLEGGLSRLKRPGIAIEMLTSGTTGPPKRIPLPYDNLTRSIEALAHYGPSEIGSAQARLRTAVTIIFAPLSHISGSWSVIESVAAGRKIALLEQFRVEPWLDLVRRHRPRFTSLPPACIRMILDSGATKQDLASLKAVRAGTAPLDPVVAQEFEGRFGVPVLIVYGATEFAGAVVGWTLHDHAECHATKRGSAGRAHPGISLRVVADDGHTVLGPNEVGSLEVKGAQLEGIGSGEWNRTQDLACIDHDGFVWIKGRNDDVILRGGFKVDTTKVAAIIERHTGVRAASVVGIPDRRLGQVPAAVVETVSSGSSKVTADEIIAWLRLKLTSYEVPTRVILVDELPRNASLKVNKKALVRFVLDASQGENAALDVDYESTHNVE